MLTSKYFGTVSGGKLFISRRGEFTEHLRSLEGKEIEVTVQKKQEPKTNNQLRYFYGVICELISEHTGHTKDEVKEILKLALLAKKVVKLGRSQFSILPSLADMTKSELSRFIDDSIMLAAQQLDVVIPDPDRVAC